jgi:hypothetical protein
MRALVPLGWGMVGLGAALLAGSLAGGQPLTGAILFAALAGSGVLMAWIGKGWDKPLESTDELLRYGRPANATVEKVEEVRLETNGTRTAKLKLHVRPRNESSYRASLRLVLPGGRQPQPGETVTVRFDPNARRRLVLLEQNFEVRDMAQNLLGG